MKLKNKIIVTFGVPSAGKTTLLKRLLDRSDIYKYYYDDSIRKSGSYLNEKIHQIFVCGKLEFLYDFQVRSMMSRYEVYVSAEKPAFVDETIYNTQMYTVALYSLGMLSFDQYVDCLKKYNYYLSSMPIPDLVIYVKCDVNVIKKRLLERGMVHEKFYSDEYLSALHESSFNIIKRLKRNLRVYEVDTTYDACEVIVDKIFTDEII